jgi:hypothetical protein
MTTKLAIDQFLDFEIGSGLYANARGRRNDDYPATPVGFPKYQRFTYP